MSNLNPLDYPICLAYPLRLAPTAWAEHVPFAMYLVDALRPRLIVELGTYHGVSYCAFCQAVSELKLDARCYAIDTWRGDAQTGLYGLEVLEELRAHHDPLYGGFSSLIESSFDDALSQFEDGSVDLLHIDGCHSYEDVRHDFESWLPKMSERGVVLLHDTNVRMRGFGVWRLWEELTPRHPHFEFIHGHGLGLVATGNEPPAALKQLLEANASEAALVREFFRQTGQRLSIRVERDQESERLNAQMQELTSEVRRLFAEMQKKEELIASLLEQQATLCKQSEAEEALRHQLSAQLAVKETQLDNIVNSRAWRWVSRYGRAKNRYLLPAYRRLRPQPRGAAQSQPPEQASTPEQEKAAPYERRIEQELAFFKEVRSVHDLPEIYHYWSMNYLRPKCESLGFSDPNDLYLRHIERLARRQPEADCRVLSVGAGNCDMEVLLAEVLLKRGVENFVFNCLDLSGEMLDRGRRLASERGVSEKFEFTETDINSWQDDRRYNVVIASQSLHHFLELELLFEKIYEALDEDGFFLVNDMIGRNGHMLWPEALEVVDALWAVLDEKYKWNHQLNSLEERYENRDCSADGFEGIRAQEILPLLLRRFEFDTFLGFAGVVTVFTGRAFGPNFDARNGRDRGFIDFLARLDDDYLESGRLKPTQMIAAMTRRGPAPARTYKHLTPEFCVRRTES